MIAARTFQGQAVAVLGLGGSGLATALALIAGGAQVAAWDDGAAAREAAAAQGIPIVDLKTADWNLFKSLVLAPGVPLTHPEPHWSVVKARAAGVEIIGDVEIFFRERASVCPGSPVIAITGTNGKSTTTALTAHLLRDLGHDVQMGGNIGRAILTLEPPAATRVHVIELSSFQIDLTPSLAPTVGVLLNITPDHIDRHGSVENYAAIKERLVRAAEAAAIGIEDEPTRAIARRLVASGAQVSAFTTGEDAGFAPRLTAQGAELFVHEVEGGVARMVAIASLAEIGTLRGRHNAQNALAALAALRALQDRVDARGDAVGSMRVWDVGRLAAGLASFGGLAHRLEEIGRVGRVAFVNDSKATNADSTEKALLAWPGDIHWIAGGKAKEGGITALAGLFPRLAKAYLIGAASEEFAETLRAGKVPFEACGTLDVAVAKAAAEAEVAVQGDTACAPVVLLSPACASYDQFKNFEERGEAFRRLVQALPGFAGRGKQA